MNTNENNVVMDQTTVQVMDVIPDTQEVQVQPEVVTQYVEVPTTNKAKCFAWGLAGFATGAGAATGLIFLIKKLKKDKEDPKPIEPEVEEE